MRRSLSVKFRVSNPTMKNLEVRMTDKESVIKLFTLVGFRFLTTQREKSGFDIKLKKHRHPTNDSR